MIFFRSSLGIALPSKLGVARRSAIAWLSGFSIRFAMHNPLFRYGAAHRSRSWLAAAVPEITPLSGSPSLYLAHHQFVREGRFVRRVSEHPQAMKALAQLWMLGQHRLHQLDITGAACHRIGGVARLVVDDQIESAQRAVGMQIHDLKALSATDQHHRLRPRR